MGKNKKLTEKQRAERYKRKAALAMYEANFSMGQIQRELGDVTVRNIRDWSVEKETCARPNCVRVAVKEYENKKYCLHCLKKRKKKALRQTRHKNKVRGKKTAQSWKERVFASWKDTPEQAAIRRSPAYQEWRVIVLGRDKYTCQHCEATGGRLVVHHIKTFKMHPDLRLEPDNGIVLCNDCHEKLHLGRMPKPRILKLRA